MAGSNDFSPIDDARDFQQFMTELAARDVSGAGLTGDEHQFQFNVRRAQGEDLVIELLPPLSRSLQDGERVQLVIGLPSGLTWIKANLHQEKINEFSLSVNRAKSEVRKLQRRASLRASVPTQFPMNFKLTSVAQSVELAGTLLHVRDLSTGGFRAEWKVGVFTPEVGQHLSGVLLLPNARPMELFGQIRSVQPSTADVWHVGVEFQPLSLKDEQALIFVCLRSITT